MLTLPNSCDVCRAQLYPGDVCTILSDGTMTLYGHFRCIDVVVEGLVERGHTVCDAAA